VANDRFLSMFFEEARELLQALEAGLMDLEAKQGDRAHVDRTFRSAHTLKGAAGMVGLAPIAEFTHKVEAVLDRIRSGALAVGADVISTLLAAKDHLDRAVTSAEEGSAIPEAPALVERLASLVEPRDEARPAEPPKAQEDTISAPVAPVGERLYRITVTPNADLLRKGVNPLGILDELRELGEARIVPVTDRVPPLEELEPKDCYLAWEVELRTSVDPEQLDEVFMFLGDRGQVVVEEVDAGQVEAEAEDEVAEAEPRIEQAVTSPTRAKTAPAPEAEPVAPEASAAKAPTTGGRIRVGSDELDQLVGMAGELALLTDNLQGLSAIEGVEPWVATIEALERVGRRLRDATLELRMVPIEELFVRFPRVVRDLAEKSGKQIALRTSGEDTRLDRTIVERLAEPMIHLIRNAIDHGLETPEERVRAGKPAGGRIAIGAGHEGDRVAIRVEDDGRGLDRAKVARKGIRLGLLPPDTPPDDPRVGNLIFEPGFSTRDQVGELSGRGVGLDVVRDTIRALRGTVTLRSVEGRGTAFLIRIPLTLAMIDGLLVEAGGARYVVPMGQVDECVALGVEELAYTMGRRAAIVRGEMIPIVSMAGAIHYGGDANGRQELLLTRHAEQRVAVAVDRLLGRVQAVIQPLAEGLAGLRRFSGATILADGSICLILDLPTVISEARTADLHAAAPLLT
jgi:two-component system chemotaxis sensor kinase CheA